GSDRRDRNPAAESGADAAGLKVGDLSAPAARAAPAVRAAPAASPREPAARGPHAQRPQPGCSAARARGPRNSPRERPWSARLSTAGGGCGTARPAPAPSTAWREGTTGGGADVTAVLRTSRDTGMTCRATCCPEAKTFCGTAVTAPGVAFT